MPNFSGISTLGVYRGAVYQGRRYIDGGGISRLSVYRGLPYIEVRGISRVAVLRLAMRVTINEFLKKQQGKSKRNNKEIETSENLAVYRVWRHMEGRCIERRLYRGLTVSED